MKIAFLGDVYPPSTGLRRDCFSTVTELVGDATIVVANVECSISRHIGRATSKFACLRCDPNSITCFKGIHCAVLGNNHISDYGHEAAHETMTLLEENRIKTQGYGSNLEEALNPLILEEGNHRIALFSFVCPSTNGWNAATPTKPGVAPLVMSLLEMQIGKYRSSVDAIFVYLHWGVENSHYPTPGQIAVARKIIDAGANVVIGTHAHVMQPYECYKDGFIFYGLGNAVFGDVEYRKWHIDGSVIEGTIRQCSESLESLCPVFQLKRASAKRVQLIDVHKIQFIDSHIVSMGYARNSVEQKYLNNRLKLFSLFRNRLLNRTNGIDVRLIHNGAYYAYKYSDKPIDQDKMWRKFGFLQIACSGWFRSVAWKVFDRYYHNR